MKITLSKQQWELIGKKATITSPDVLLAHRNALEKHKLLSAINLAIPCLEDWIEKTGFGETYQRDLKALNALKNVVKEIDPEGYLTNAPFEK